MPRDPEVSPTVGRGFDPNSKLFKTAKEVKQEETEPCNNPNGCPYAGRVVKGTYQFYCSDCMDDRAAFKGTLNTPKPEQISRAINEFNKGLEKERKTL